MIWIDSQIVHITELTEGFNNWKLISNQARMEDFIIFLKNSLMWGKYNSG